MYSLKKVIKVPIREGNKLEWKCGKKFEIISPSPHKCTNEPMCQCATSAQIKLTDSEVCSDHMRTVDEYDKVQVLILYLKSGEIP